MRRLLLSTALLLAYPNFGFASERNVDFCLAKDENWSTVEHQRRMAEFGIECATVYYKLNAKQNRDAPYVWVKEYLDEGYKVIMVLQIDSEDNTPLHETLKGENDDTLADLLFEIKQDGRPMITRGWYESDGNWYSHQIYYPGNSIPLHVEAFEYLHKKLENSGVLSFVSLESNFNRKDALNWKPLSEGELYIPQINMLVSMHSGSNYNRCGSSDNHTDEKSFEDEFGPFYDRLASFTDKPINIAEVSTSGLCTDGIKLPWFRDMLESVDKRFTRVETITFVFGTVPVGAASNTVEIPWGFSSDAERAAFADLLNEYRRKWGMPEVKRFTRSTDTPKLDLSFGADSAPWSIWARFTYPFDEIDNTAINSSSPSDETFDKSGPVFRLVAKQRWLTNAPHGFDIGPGIQAGLVRAPENDQQWWHDYDEVGLTFGAYRSIPRTRHILWGNLSFELLASKRWYRTDNIPNRLKDNPEWLGIRVEPVLSGNHSR